MLRYGLYKLSQTVTIREEIDDLNNYCFLMDKRFGDRIRSSVSVQDVCMDARVPCRILQPLVENAYKHGMGSVMENGWIGITIQRIDKRVHIVVEDNGSGFDDAQLYKISDGKQKGEEQGIGLINVIKRMRLFYKDDFQSEINSIPYESTTIAFEFPMR